MTKEIKLNHGYKTIVDDEDFESLNRYGWILIKSANNRYAGRVVPKNNGGYIVRMHREILGLKPNDERIIDHLDGNGLNNTKINLRITSSAINCQNQRCRIKKNRTGFIGVTEHIRNKKWRAEIGFSMNRLFLGMFNSPEDAGKAYDNAALFYFGKDAKTNFHASHYKKIVAPINLLISICPDEIDKLDSSIAEITEKIKKSIL